MAIVKVDTDEVSLLVKQGSDIVMNPKAENALVQLLYLQDMIDKAVEVAKSAIEKKALEYNPNFSVIVADKVKIGYRTYGTKYSIDKDNFDKLPEAFYTKRISYSPNSKEIDKFIEEHNGLPLGINENDRTKKISMKLIEDYDAENII